MCKDAQACLSGRQVAVDYRPTCWNCKRVHVSFMGRPWHFNCHRCGAQNGSPPNLEPLPAGRGETKLIPA